MSAPLYDPCPHEWIDAGYPAITSCVHCGKIWRPVPPKKRDNGAGKKGQAPCGHEGTAVISNFFICDFGCDADAIPKPVQDPVTAPMDFDLGANWNDPCPPHDMITYSFGISKCVKCGWAP